MRSLCFIEMKPWQGQAVADSAMVSCVHTSKETGMEGRPLPQNLRDNAAITSIFLFCFFLFACALKNNKKYIGQHLKNLFVHKHRASLFDDSPDSNRGFIFVLSFISCILIGIGLYKYHLTAESFLLSHIPDLFLLGIYVGCTLAFLFLKWVFYGFVNWIFFDKEQCENWNRTYFDLAGGICFLLFPLLLLAVYLNLSFQISNYLMLFVLLMAELMLFYKCARNFFSQIYGFLHFILYFCALELVPLILFWKVIDYINNILILKF